MTSFWGELKRRNVVRVAIAYAVVSWLLIQVADVVLDNIEAPTWVFQAILLLLVIGFPVAIIFAWAFELTPEGIKKEKDVDRSESITHTTGRKLDFIIIGVLAVALIGAVGVWIMDRDARWARDEAFPHIDEHILSGDFEAAYALAKEVEKVLPNDPELLEFWGRFTRVASIPSDPPGATVYRRAYSATDAEWEELGTTPLHDVRIPVGMSLLRIELEGHRTILRVIGNGFLGSSIMPVADRSQGTIYNINPERYVLDTVDTLPEDMVRVPGRSLAVDGELTELSDFFIARFEVTNREFKEFIDAGGYGRRDLWEHEFLLLGESIPWVKAMDEFVDRSGRPGPSTWTAGNYPESEDGYPVTGVSWYEAAAYARFVGQELPTVHHWRRAYAAATLAWLLPASNLDSDRVAPSGQYQGVGWTGTFDMAGNAREWCFNAIGDQRAILGGGWNDALYMVQETIQDPGRVPPFDRSPTNGFRLAIGQDEAVTEQRLRAAISQPDVPPLLDPVSDEVFAAYLSDFQYDPSPFNATVEETVEERFWTRETISFDAGYGGERMFLYLYSPNDEAPRHQTIVYWAGVGALYLDSIDMNRVHLDFALKNGRAVAIPVIKGTYQRRLPTVPAWTSVAGRDLAIQQVRDFRRAIDYLETRPDIDSDSLAYYGVSWGGRVGATVLAVEPRLKVGILNQAGIEPNVHPDSSAAHYLPRVTVPVLQFNGRYDADFRYEELAKPFFELLATPAADKKHVVEPTGHFVPQPIYIGETLNWLDKYLGPPE